jgi:hypothetical protein
VGGAEGGGETSAAADGGSVSNGNGGAPDAAPAAAVDRPSELSRYRLVVFQMVSTTLVLLVADEETRTWSQPLWYQSLRAQILPELQPLATTLTEQHSRFLAVEEPHRFLYFNRVNLALKSSIRT